MTEPKPSDLFSILPDEEKRTIVRAVYKRHAESMSADIVRAEVIECAKALAPELARVAVDAFSREFRSAHTGFGNRTSQWDDMIRAGIAKGIESYLATRDITISPRKDGAS